MFTRMLIGLDGSPNADEALEQAVHLGQRFKSRLLVVHVKEPRSMLEERRASDSGALLERAKERVQDAGLPVDVVQKHGDPDIELAALARDVDTVLVGRRGRSSPQDVVGKTVGSLIRIAERTVIVCASKPSPMKACAVAYDGRETAQRALELAARFASVIHSTVHVIHATIDPSAGTGGGARHRPDAMRRAVRGLARGWRSESPQRRHRFARRGDSAAHRHSRGDRAVSGTFVLVHADESCLGNDSSKPSRGGNGALIEAPAGDSVARWDFYECSPQTTNNKMALAGAIGTLEWLRRQWGHAMVRFVSDSEYLIKGMTEWLPVWEARGWRRKTGALENVELWQKLSQVAKTHKLVDWPWVRGHNEHVKNEYANIVAIRAADEQQRSNGLIPSGFDTWLAQQHARGKFLDFDPDKELHERST